MMLILCWSVENVGKFNLGGKWPEGKWPGGKLMGFMLNLWMGRLWKGFFQEKLIDSPFPILQSQKSSKLNPTWAKIQQIKVSSKNTHQQWMKQNSERNFVAPKQTKNTCLSGKSLGKMGKSSISCILILCLFLPFF